MNHIQKTLLLAAGLFIGTQAACSDTMAGGAQPATDGYCQFLQCWQKSMGTYRGCHPHLVDTIDLTGATVKSHGVYRGIRLQDGNRVVLTAIGSFLQKTDRSLVPLSRAEADALRAKIDQSTVVAEKHIPKNLLLYVYRMLAKRKQAY